MQAASRKLVAALQAAVEKKPRRGPPCAVALITGMPGVGKSALACQVYSQLEPDFATCCKVDMHNQAAVAAATESWEKEKEKLMEQQQMIILQLAGQHYTPPSLDVGRGMLQDALSKQAAAAPATGAPASDSQKGPVLLLLDNVRSRHVGELLPCDLLQLLPACSMVLVSSCETTAAKSLRAASHIVHHVQPLDKVAAAELLSALLSAKEANPEPSEVDSVLQVCGGLPLALLTAAKSNSVLFSGAKGNALEAALNQHLMQLNEEQRTVASVIAHLLHGASWEAVAAVYDRVLDELFTQCLVESRYGKVHMHPVLRAFFERSPVAKNPCLTLALDSIDCKDLEAQLETLAKESQQSLLWLSIEASWPAALPHSLNSPYLLFVRVLAVQGLPAASLPLEGLPCLTFLSAVDMPELSELPGIQQLAYLATLELASSPNIPPVTQLIASLTNLRALRVANCPNWLEPAALSAAVDLTALLLQQSLARPEGASSVVFAGLPNLQTLLISQEPGLATVTLQQCEVLECVGIQGCGSLKTITLNDCPNIVNFQVADCKEVTSIQGLEKQSLKYLSSLRLDGISEATEKALDESVKPLLDNKEVERLQPKAANEDVERLHPQPAKLPQILRPRVWASEQVLQQAYDVCFREPSAPPPPPDTPLPSLFPALPTTPPHVNWIPLPPNAAAPANQLHISTEAPQADNLLPGQLPSFEAWASTASPSTHTTTSTLPLSTPQTLLPYPSSPGLQPLASHQHQLPAPPSGFPPTSLPCTSLSPTSLPTTTLSTSFNSLSLKHNPFPEPSAPPLPPDTPLPSPFPAFNQQHTLPTTPPHVNWIPLPPNSAAPANQLHISTEPPQADNQVPSFEAWASTASPSNHATTSSTGDLPVTTNPASRTSPQPRASSTRGLPLTTNPTGHITIQVTSAMCYSTGGLPFATAPCSHSVSPQLASHTQCDHYFSPHPTSPMRCGSAEAHQLCRICWDCDRSVAFRPCGHIVACEECAEKILRMHGTCAICMVHIQSIKTGLRLP